MIRAASADCELDANRIRVGSLRNANCCAQRIVRLIRSAIYDSGEAGVVQPSDEAFTQSHGRSALACVDVNLGRDTGTVDVLPVAGSTNLVGQAGTKRALKRRGIRRHRLREPDVGEHHRGEW
jgi:hypothetical protein